MIIKLQRIILHEVFETIGLTNTKMCMEIIEIEKLSLVKNLQRILKENNYQTNLVDSIDSWYGGDENCQCYGCAELINPIEQISLSDDRRLYSYNEFIEDPKGGILSINFDTNKAELYLDNRYL